MTWATPYRRLYDVDENVLYLLDFGAGSSKEKSKTDSTGTRAGTKSDTQTQTTNLANTSTSRALPQTVIDSLSAEITKTAGEGTTIPGLEGITMGAQQLSQLAIDRAVRASDERAARINSIVSAARADTENRIQQQTTRLAQATGGTMNTAFNEFSARVIGDELTKLGGFQAELELAAIDSGQKDIAQAAQVSNEIANTLINADLQPKALRANILSSLTGAVAGGTVTSEETRTGTDIVSIMAQFSESFKEKGTATGKASGMNFGFGI